MNKNLLLGCVAVIAVLPIVYLVINGVETEERRSFRGRPVVELAPQDGTLVVPTDSENKNAAPMLAKVNLAFAEKISGLKPPGNAPLEISMTTVDRKVAKCADDGTVPTQAGFDIAATCAPVGFEKYKAEHKTALQVDAESKVIIFGASANNQIRLYHKGIIATYNSIDVTQSDRKREVCIVRILIDHVVARPANAEASCQGPEQG